LDYGNHGRTETQDAHECAGRCALISDCIGSSWWSDGGCHIATYGAVLINAPDWEVVTSYSCPKAPEATTTTTPPLRCGSMVRHQSCSTDGQFTAGTASDQNQCAEVCETLNREGCCEWQSDHQKCLFQPNDASIPDDSAGFTRFATMCTSTETEETSMAQSIFENSSSPDAITLTFALIGMGSVLYGFYRSFVKVPDYKEVQDDAEAEL